MNLPFAITIAATVVVLVSAQSHSSVVAPSTAQQSTATTTVSATSSLPFIRLHNSFNSGFTKPSEFVIQDGDEFARRWRGVVQGTPDAAKPEIDFEKTTVVFVTMGARNTGGYTIHVDSVTAESNNATVYYTTTSPGSRCMSMQMLSSPIEVISLDRIAGTVKFKKRTMKGPC